MVMLSRSDSTDSALTDYQIQVTLLDPGSKLKSKPHPVAGPEAMNRPSNENISIPEAVMTDLITAKMGKKRLNGSSLTLRMLEVPHIHIEWPTKAFQLPDMSDDQLNDEKDALESNILHAQRVLRAFEEVCTDLLISDRLFVQRLHVYIPFEELHHASSRLYELGNDELEITWHFFVGENISTASPIVAVAQHFKTMVTMGEEDSGIKGSDPFMAFGYKLPHRDDITSTESGKESFMV